MQKIAFKKKMCVYFIKWTVCIKGENKQKFFLWGKKIWINIVVTTFYLILKCISYAKLKTEYSNFVCTKVHYPL